MKNHGFLPSIYTVLMQNLPLSIGKTKEREPFQKPIPLKYLDSVFNGLFHQNIISEDLNEIGINQNFAPVLLMPLLQIK